MAQKVEAAAGIKTYKHYKQDLKYSKRQSPKTRNSATAMLQKAISRWHAGTKRM